MKIPGDRTDRHLAERLGLSHLVGLRNNSFTSIAKEQAERLLRDIQPIVEERRLVAEMAMAQAESERLLANRPPEVVFDYGISVSIQLAAQNLKDSLQHSIEVARLTGHLALPDMLEPYRLPDIVMASQLADALRTPWWHNYQMDALNSHAALAGMLDQTRYVDREALSTVQSVLSHTISGIESARHARQFLDISGLLRFPSFRVLTKTEKRRKIRHLVKESAPPAHVKKAHALNHRYEVVIRVLIAQRMELVYGEDWVRERLPKCDCKKLLGMQVEGGESILDSADFVHYALIMCHEEHFEAAFSDGYESPDALRQIILRLGRLRARSHHARMFTAEDWREMSTLWRTIESGWHALIDDVEDLE